MSLEEINKWLNNEYGVSYTKLEELHDFYFEKYCDLKQENQKYKEVIDKATKYINDNLIISSILGGKKYYTISDYSFDYRELLDILKEVE